MNDRESISKLLEALRPWLTQLVIVGGWAHRLHRLHPLASPPAYQPVLTKDADVAISPTDRIEGDIAEALRSADFQEELSGDHHPPVSQYSLGKEGGFYVEFLAPLRGSRQRRRGGPDATVSMAGVTAQKLRYLELLMINPLTVQLGPAVGFALEPSAGIRIVHPVTFVAQKLLIEKERTGEKRSQDVLYIHDTLELFGSNLSELSKGWRDSIRPSIHPKTVGRIEELAAEQFSKVTDTIRRAARIPQDRTLSPEILRNRTQLGLEVLFGTSS